MAALAPPAAAEPVKTLEAATEAARPGGDPWETVLAAAAPNRRLRVLINDCKLVEVKDDVVVLAVSETLLGAVRSSERELCDLLATAWSRAVRIEVRGTQSETPAPVALDQEAARAEASTHPLVVQAIELLGGRLIGVQPRKPDPA